MVSFDDNFTQLLMKKVDLYDETNRFSDLDTEMENDMAFSILSDNKIDKYIPTFLFKFQNKKNEFDIRYIGYYPMKAGRFQDTYPPYYYTFIKKGIKGYKLKKEWNNCGGCEVWHDYDEESNKSVNIV